VSAYRRRAVRRHAAAGARSKKKQKFFSVCFKDSTGRYARRSFEMTLKDASQATPAR